MVKGQEGQAQWGDLALRQGPLVGMEERCLGVARQGQPLLGVGQQRLLLGPLPGEQLQGRLPDGDKEVGRLLIWQADHNRMVTVALKPRLRYRIQRS